MIIVGIDPSLNGTGMTKMYLDDTFNVTKTEYKGFSSVKKYESDNIIHYKKSQFKNDIERNRFMYEHIIRFCEVGNIEYICMEDYAYATTTGQVFNIGEFVGLIKHNLYYSGFKIRMIEPTVIKKYATMQGNADKVRMEDEYMKTDPLNIEKGLQEYKSPKIDIIDSYFMADFLRLELKLRHGLEQVKNLPLKHIEIFNQVSKSNTVNILARDFLYE